MQLKTFAPEAIEAEESGFLQCPKCGLVWFGRLDYDFCPVAPHGRPVRVAVLCRECDSYVPIEQMAAHLTVTPHRTLTKLEPV